MDENSITTLLNWYCKNYKADVEMLRRKIETGNISDNFISFLEENRTNIELPLTLKTAQLLWVFTNYCSGSEGINNLSNWMDWIIDNKEFNGNEDLVRNAVQSQSTIIEEQINCGHLTINELESVLDNKEMNSILTGKDKAFKTMKIHVKKLVKENQTQKTEKALKAINMKLDSISDDLINEKENKDNPESKDIDGILNEMFPGLVKHQLDAIIGNLNGKDSYVALTYNKTKKQLWRDLDKLRLADFKRGRIADVFAKSCKWEKHLNLPPKELKRAEIYKNIGKKG